MFPESPPSHPISYLKFLIRKAPLEGHLVENESHDLDFVVRKTLAWGKWVVRDVPSHGRLPAMAETGAVRVRVPGPGLRSLPSAPDAGHVGQHSELLG